MLNKWVKSRVFGDDVKVGRWVLLRQSSDVVRNVKVQRIAPVGCNLDVGRPLAQSLSN